MYVEAPTEVSISINEYPELYSGQVKILYDSLCAVEACGERSPVFRGTHLSRVTDITCPFIFN